MIVFINGPFGVGKTTTAKIIVEKLPNAMLYDPEEVGAEIHTDGRMPEEVAAEMLSNVGLEREIQTEASAK